MFAYSGGHGCEYGNINGFCGVTRLPPMYQDIRHSAYRRRCMGEERDARERKLWWVLRFYFAPACNAAGFALAWYHRSRHLFHRGVLEQRRRLMRLHKSACETPSE